MSPRVRWMSFCLAALAAVNTPRAAGGSKPETPTTVPSLTLRLVLIQPVLITFDRIGVEWQLENSGRDSLQVCQWPGIAFSQSWDCPDGTSKGVIPGYPESRKLERKYFLTLSPGEALIGHGSVDVWSTPSGKLSLRAEFRCDQDGRDHGLAGWNGRIMSELETVDVPKDPNAKSCQP